MSILLLSLLWALIHTCTMTACVLRNPVWIAINFVIGLAAGGLVAFLYMPAIGFFYASMWFFMLSAMIPASLLAFMALFSYEHSDSRSPQPLPFVFCTLAFFVLFIATTFTGFHAQRYAALLQVEETKEFKDADIFLNQEEARLIDHGLAYRSASELLGEELGIGSRYNIGEMRIQNIGGELRWVAPFEHRSFFRWMSDGTSPGYITVSASSYNDATMVLDNAEINYGTAGFYGFKSLDRHLYVNGYHNVIMGDFAFETNDQGKPYWVVPILDTTIGFGGKKVTGIVVVDATTGAIQAHSVEDAPSWVDRIQPMNLVESYITKWGLFKDGFINGVFIGNQVVEPTRGTSFVFDKKGRGVWYTGIQSMGASQQGTMGFMLVDSRTGKATLYRRAGITERAAKLTIEGRVQEAGYYATNPIPYQVNGISTFISILKDYSGNPQGVGLVAYNDRSLVATGENMEIALRRYLSVLAGSNSSLADVSVEQELIRLEGQVRRSVLQNSDNRTLLHFMLSHNDHPGKFFTVSADGNKEALHTRDGDRVSIQVSSLKPKHLNVVRFDNLELN